MALLAGTHYDPAVAVSKATSGLLAMTAFDTTNLRLSFTVPANGAVMVRIKCQEVGATTYPDVLLGVLQSATVIARVVPIGGVPGTAVATTAQGYEAVFAVSGLSPGAGLTWDAAYGVEIVLASTNIKYGGPNTNAGANAWGGFTFEIWEAPHLLGSIIYDPGTAVSKATSSLLALTAIDSTNLRLSFNAPSSGKVLVRMSSCVHGATTFPQIILGVLTSGAAVMGRGVPMGGLQQTALATARLGLQTEFLVTGLTPAAAQVWDAAYAVQVLVASTGLKYGGPNNATTDDAWGAFVFEAWEA